MTRKRYSDSFKSEAVKLVVEQARSVEKTAKDLGGKPIGPTTVGRCSKN